MNGFCPCCEKHCPKNDLHCHRGIEHFGIKDEEPRYNNDRSENPEEKMIVLLRKCGHFLHHNAGRKDTASLTDALTSEEIKTLETLLEKCLNNWQNLNKQIN